jgi:hypothetical protein
LGGTVLPITGEYNFAGYIKEFRWWNTMRSGFNVNAFQLVYFTTVPASLIAYWRLDEKNDGSVTLWKDSAAGGPTYDPSVSAVPTYSLVSVTEMRELYLVICPEG